MAKKEIKTSIQITASPTRIWKILTNFENYEHWNPFIRSISGVLTVGEKLAVNAGGMNFTPLVKVVEEGKEIRWLGNLLFKGLFDGEHIFKIIDNRDGTCTFKHEERFNGILVGLFKKKLEVDTKNGFIEMNERLKELAEK